jgi:hypothetical protein
MRELLAALSRDPARTRRRVAVGVAAPALVVAAVWALAPSAPPACAPAAARLAGVWDGPAPQAARRRLRSRPARRRGGDLAARRRQAR